MGKAILNFQMGVENNGFRRKFVFAFDLCIIVNLSSLVSLLTQLFQIWNFREVV